MKNIFVLTILAAIFTFNVVNAQTVTSHNGGKPVKVVSTTHSKNIKKMKDTNDQLMSRQQQSNTSDHSSASV
jgi:hypothetical protein